MLAAAALAKTGGRGEQIVQPLPFFKDAFCFFVLSWEFLTPFPCFVLFVFLTIFCQ